jgi:5-methylcytosine-specific restriction protein A
MPGNPFYSSKFWRDLRKQALERDQHRCTVPGCPNTARMGRMYVDHVTTRPNVTTPTPLDRLDNLRTLCGPHDAMVKEARGGSRKNGGKLSVRGCDPSGRPLCPNHHWNAGFAK